MIKSPRCNWEYSGEYDTNTQGAIKTAFYRTDCGKEVVWTRNNKIGRLFENYNNQSVPQHTDFYVKCPYCHRILNIYNPYDNGETWRE